MTYTLPFLTPTTPPHIQRNREGTLLILYDQNDGTPAEAVAMATELVLRGWENVYVLSGGAWVVCRGVWIDR